MNYVGIDISKESFDVALSRSEKYAHYKFSNNASGFKQFYKLLDKTHHWCVMEASGPYYQKLAMYLQANEISLSVVNPLVIRRFCQMRLVKAKTDKKDAVMIAEYGKTEQPKAWKADAPYLLELKQMQAYLEQLDKSRTGFIRQLEAFKQSPVMNKEVKRGIATMIKTTEKQMQQVEQKMEEIIRTHHQQMFEQVKSIPGVGKKTSLLLVVISGGFTKFENAKQLSSYLGLSPRIFESGTSVKGKVRICKMGMSRARAMLYVCSWSAIKCNKACKELYHRLLEKGKAKQLALIAVANKLLKQAFALATKEEFYKTEFI
jgi:transposase